MAYLIVNKGSLDSKYLGECENGTIYKGTGINRVPYGSYDEYNGCIYRGYSGATRTEVGYYKDGTIWKGRSFYANVAGCYKDGVLYKGGGRLGEYVCKCDNILVAAVILLLGDELASGDAYMPAQAKAAGSSTTQGCQSTPIGGIGLGGVIVFFIGLAILAGILLWGRSIAIENQPAVALFLKYGYPVLMAIVVLITVRAKAAGSGSLCFTDSLTTLGVLVLEGFICVDAFLPYGEYLYRTFFQASNRFLEFVLHLVFPFLLFLLSFLPLCIIGIVFVSAANHKGLRGDYEAGRMNGTLYRLIVNVTAVLFLQYVIIFGEESEDAVTFLLLILFYGVAALLAAKVLCKVVKS